MAQRRKATRNATGGELSEKQAQAEFVKIRDGPLRIKRAATLRAIKRYYEADEIEVTSKKVSLICPISKTRVKVPVRSVNCRHMECFDLRSYLNYHQQLTFWECPFSCCKAQARCDSLRVDEYMSDVLRATEDCVQEVEVFADGTFKAVQRTSPTKAVIIDDEDPYVPDSDSDTEPVVKAETNNDNPDEPMEIAVSIADEGQSQAYPLVAGGEEQSLEALHQSRPTSATLRCEPSSANNLVEQAESEASILRDDSDLLREEPSATAQYTHEITAENQEQQAWLAHSGGGQPTDGS
ncbi:siz1p [Aphelenchoides avenae]|nr:siz1p [Aphelenchus avenae]